MGGFSNGGRNGHCSFPLAKMVRTTILVFFRTHFCSCPVCPLVSLLHQARQRTLLSLMGSSPAAPARRSPSGISVPSEESMCMAGSSNSVLTCARRPAKEASAIHRLCNAHVVVSASRGARCLALARGSRRRNADAPLLIRPPTSMPSTAKRHLTRPPRSRFRAATVELLWVGPVFFFFSLGVAVMLWSARLSFPFV